MWIMCIESGNDTLHPDISFLISYKAQRTLFWLLIHQIRLPSTHILEILTSFKALLIPTIVCPQPHYYPPLQIPSQTLKTKTTPSPPLNPPNKIYIYIQSRNRRKTLTTVSGIPSKFNLKKTLKVIKKQFVCNGTIVNNEKAGEVV